MKRVLITEAVNGPLSALAGFEVEERDGLWRDPPALKSAVRDCAALIVRNQTAVDRELIGAARGLRVVGRLGVGLDNLDLEALRERSIEVVHGGGLNARAVAEYVVGACFVLARRLATSDREVRAGEWRRHLGVELRGRAMGLIGLGATGAETAKLALALGMSVAGSDPVLDAPSGVRKVSLEEVLRRSEFVSVHVPLAESTRGLLGEEQLAMLPAGAIVVNAARGGVVDEAALLRALESGHLAGAALDVRVSEPPPQPDPFAGRDDVLLTAHLAGLTQESQRAIADQVLAGVRQLLT